MIDPRPSYLLLVAYLSCAGLLATGHIQNPDSHLRLAQAGEWFLSGSIALPEGTGNPSHGNFVILDDGNRYSIYNPGQILAAAFAYGLAALVTNPQGLDRHYTAGFFLSFVSPICHFLTAWLLFVFANQLFRSRARAYLISFSFAFGTFCLPHGLDAYEHSQEMLFVLLAFFFSDDGSHNRAPGDSYSAGHVFVGVSLGVAMMFRSSAVLAILPILLWRKQSFRELASFLSGMIPFIAILLWYNWFRFGSPLDSGYTMAWALSQPGPMTDQPWVETPVFEGLLGLWASPGKGLVPFSPVLATIPVGWALLRKEMPRQAWSILLIAGLYSVVYGVNWAWHGSIWSWGPRYIVPIVPFLCLCLPYPRTRRLTTCFAVLVAFSVLVQVVASATDYRRYLVETLKNEPGVFSTDELIWNPTRSPLLGQIGSLHHVLSNHKTDLDHYTPPGPWRSEARPATLEMMLASSIDFNSLNVWWIRAGHFKLSMASIVAGRLALIALCISLLTTTILLARSELSSRAP